MLNLQDASLLRTQCLIDGQWVGSEQTIAVTNPATGAVDHVHHQPKLEPQPTEDVCLHG